MSHAPTPVVGTDVYLAPTAYVAGDVVLGDQVTVMHHVVIRGDIAPIRIGSRVNVQDGVILHTPRGVPLEIADDVVIAHRAVVHGRRIGRRSLIGIGAILLDHCEIGNECVVAAGTVVPPGMTVSDGSVVMGIPGRVVRKIEPRDLSRTDDAIQSYIQLGRHHAAGRFPNICTPETNVGETGNLRAWHGTTKSVASSD